MTDRPISGRYYKFDTDNGGDHTYARKKSYKEKFTAAKRYIPANLRPSWANMLLALLTIVFLAIGISIGIGIFFALRDLETKTALLALNGVADNEADHLQAIITNAVRIVETMRGYFTVANNEVLMYEDYEPFINVSGLLIPGVKAIAYAPIIQDAELDAKIAEIRSWGKYHTNFYLNTRNAQNQIVPINRTTGRQHNPIVYISPIHLTYVALGFDYPTNKPRWDAIQKANRTKQPAATDQINVAIYLGTTLAEVLVHSPVFRDTSKNTELIGTSVGVFHVPDLLRAATTQGILNQTVVSMFDRDAVNPNNTFLHSSLQNNQLNGYYNVSALKKDDFIRITNTFMTCNRTIYMADRSWSIFFTATNSFLWQYQNFEKWLMLFLPALISVIFSAIVIGFTKRLQFTRKIRDVQQQRLAELEINKKKLEQLLNRIADQERVTRLTNNAVPDYIIVIAMDGRIISTNTSFDTKFNFSDEEYRRGVMITRIFPEIGVFEPKMLSTSAKTRLGATVPILLFMRSLLPKDGLLDPDDDRNDKPAYVVIARNTAENAYTSLERREKHGHFDEHWRDPEFRTEFLRFSLRENNQENIRFLLDVLQYRWSPIEKRVELQAEIYEKYFGEKAEEELNVTSTIVQNLAYRMASGTGDIDLFDEVEDAVREMIKSDMYPRFVDEQKRRGSTIKW